MGTSAVRVVEIDPTDEPLLRSAWRVAEEASRDGRPHAVPTSYAAFSSEVQRPTPYYQQIVLAGLVGDETVATAVVGLAPEDNQHLADLQLAVHPRWRRRGIGTHLYDAASRRILAATRTTALGEAYAPIDGPSAATAFAERLGFQRVHTQDHLVLALPMPPDRVSGLRSRVAHLADGYDILTWRDRCPDEHLAPYCALITQMQRDVPLGEVDFQPYVYDEARVRAAESAAVGASGHVVAAVRRRRDGEWGGYSVVVLPHDAPEAVQDETLVMPEHRGHRLGLLMKLATLDLVQGDPSRTVLHTWTAPDNDAMHRTNITFGYQPVEQLHEMQRRVGEAG